MKRKMFPTFALLLLYRTISAYGENDFVSGTEQATVPSVPKITSLHIASDIRSRFATTVVTSHLINEAEQAQEAVFRVILPNAAFISNFTIEIDGVVVVGEVKEKENAKKEYDRAKQAGQSAGHVMQSPRETNNFEIAINIGAGGKLTFNLTYQEVLKRVHGVYKHVVNVQPGQVVDDLLIRVHIAENVEIKSVHVPQFGATTGQKTNSELLAEPDEPHALVQSVISSSQSDVDVTFKPTADMQIGVNSSQGLSGQFVVLYDVARLKDGGRIEVVNGYFVHFFAPGNMDVSPKHVVFVLDRSGSMQGHKIEQTQEAMQVILEDLNHDDYFNILTFSDAVERWKPESVSARSRENIRDAVTFVRSIKANGGTNINEALMESLHLIRDSEMDQITNDVIIFLTDGEATAGTISSWAILNNVHSNNSASVPIHSIAFGEGADFALLKKLSLQNHGLARKVYQDSDAALQMQGFYAEISNPLLTNITVHYLNETIEPNSLVYDYGYDYYQGGELVFAGKLASTDVSVLEGEIWGTGSYGHERFKVTCPLPHPWDNATNFPMLHPAEEMLPLATQTVGGFVERTWAYLSIKKLLDKANYMVENSTIAERLKTEALRLSLKYNFVTELTSMVAILPGQHNETALDSSGKEQNHHDLRHSYSIYARARPKYSYGDVDMLSLADTEAESEIIQAPVLVTGGPRLPTGKKPRPTKKPKPAQTADELVCSAGEIAMSCGNQCEQTCHTLHLPITCPLVCKSPACGCDQDYARHSNGSCVKISDCPSPCGKNEHMSACGSRCESTCTEVLDGSIKRCPLVCDAPACTCDDDFVRGPRGRCILPESCTRPGATVPCPPKCPNGTFEAINEKGCNVCQFNELASGTCPRVSIQCAAGCKLKNDRNGCPLLCACSMLPEVVNHDFVVPMALEELPTEYRYLCLQIPMSTGQSVRLLDIPSQGLTINGRVTTVATAAMRLAYLTAVEIEHDDGKVAVFNEDEFASHVGASVTITTQGDTAIVRVENLDAAVTFQRLKETPCNCEPGQEAIVYFQFNQSSVDELVAKLPANRVHRMGVLGLLYTLPHNGRVEVDLYEGTPEWVGDFVFPDPHNPNEHLRTSTVRRLPLNSQDNFCWEILFETTMEINGKLPLVYWPSTHAVSKPTQQPVGQTPKPQLCPAPECPSVFTQIYDQNGCTLCQSNELLLSPNECPATVQCAPGCPPGKDHQGCETLCVCSHNTNQALIHMIPAHFEQESMPENARFMCFELHVREGDMVRLLHLPSERFLISGQYHIVETAAQQHVYLSEIQVRFGAENLTFDGVNTPDSTANVKVKEVDQHETVLSFPTLANTSLTIVHQEHRICDCDPGNESVPKLDIDQSSANRLLSSLSARVGQVHEAGLLGLLYSIPRSSRVETSVPDSDIGELIFDLPQKPGERLSVGTKRIGHNLLHEDEQCWMVPYEFLKTVLGGAFERPLVATDVREFLDEGTSDERL